MNKKAVLFDLDDTLLWDERAVNEAFERTCREAAGAVAVDPAELERSVREAARELYQSYDIYPFTQMIGINPFEALWGHFRDGVNPEFRRLEKLAPAYRRDAWTLGLRRLGIEDAALGAALAERFGEIRRTLSYVYDDTYSTLDALKGNYRLLLLTNGSPELQREKLNGEPRLAAYFDHIVISGNFGKGKPDPDLFAHAMELLGIRPEEGIMVGDRATDILGASRVGMDSVWINRHGLSASGEAKPTHTIGRLGELPELLGR